MATLDELLAEEVRFSFASEGDRASRWQVRSVSWEERLGRPYEAWIELADPSFGAVPSLLLGHDAELALKRGSTRRRVLGVVDRVEHGETTDRFLLARVRLVPALKLLEATLDSRVLQQRTVPEVLEEVLGEALAAYGRDARFELARTDYARREHCVQLQESTASFVHRLMEEEGIGYFFEHEGEAETMVLVDAPESYPETEGWEGGVPMSGWQGLQHQAESIHRLVRASQLLPTSVAVRLADWTQDRAEIDAERSGQDGQGRERRRFEHDTRLTPFEYDPEAGRYQRNDAEAQARLRHELAARDATVVRGAGTVLALEAGRVFELRAHPASELDARYLILAVSHRGRTPALGEPGGGAEARYENELVAIPADTPYRPARETPRPRVAGHLTGEVVGPEGEEIHTDEHGRVRVRFHWQLASTRPEQGTAWVRVMQGWAGPGFGSLSIPRVGMEVVLSFLDGDPERPVVSGCLHNGKNRPPVALPSDRPQTLLRTQSSPGGRGYNELRFDDSAEHEQIALRAQKDLHEEVLDSRTSRVGRNDARSVGEAQTLQVGGDRELSIDGSVREVIRGGQEVIVHGEGAQPGYRAQVTGEHVIEATDAIVLRCGDSEVRLEPGKIELRSGNGNGATTLILDAMVFARSAGSAQISLDQEVSAYSAEGASLELTDRADLKSAGAASTLKLDDGAQLKTSGMAHIRGGDAAVVRARAVHLGAQRTVTVDGPEKVVVSGGSIELN